MKYYHRINRYILERYPILWMTHFVWLMLLGVMLHLLFWFFGHTVTDIELLKDYNIDTYFYKSGFVWMYGIIEMTALIYFGFRYLNHHPFRNFYPLGKNYFSKLSLVIAAIFSLHLSIPFAFESGMKAKGYALINREQEHRDIDIANKSFPFFFRDLNEYSILEKSYPAPFPLRELSYFNIGYDTVKEEEILHGIDHTQPFVTLNQHEYQFAEVYDTLIQCNYESRIRKIVDVHDIPGLREFSLLNYKGSYITYSRDSMYDDTTYLPYVHEVYNRKNKEELTNLFQQLKDLCIRYKLDYEIDPAAMSELVFAQDLNQKQLIYVTADRSNWNGNRTHPAVTKALDSAQVTADAVALAVTESMPPSASDDVDRLAETLKSRHIEMSKGNYLADLSPFSNIIENLNAFESIGYVRIPTYFFLFLLLILGISFLFILIKHIQVADLLMGVLYSFLLGTLFVLMNLMMHHRAGIDYLAVGLVYLVLLFFSCIYLGLQRERLSKRNNMRLFLPLSIGMQVFLPLLLYFIQDSTKVYHKDPCTLEGNWEATFDIEPWHVLGFEVFALLLVFRYLRALHASKE
jgi:hypothetical protein